MIFENKILELQHTDNMHIIWKEIWWRIQWCQNKDASTYTKLFFQGKTKINYFYVMIPIRWVIYESYHMTHVLHSKGNSIYYRMVINHESSDSADMDLDLFILVGYEWLIRMQWRVFEIRWLVKLVKNFNRLGHMKEEIK